MFADDNEPKKKPPFQIGQDLSDLSVDDLNDAIGALKDEIGRLEKEALDKKRSKDAASAIFKS